MPRRFWSRYPYGLDFWSRNEAGSAAAQRGADLAAVARRSLTRPVMIARSAADDPPVPIPAKRRP